jgi:hypothetical protein
MPRRCRWRCDWLRVLVQRKIEALRGKYLFTDLSTGHVWYADYAEMLAADDDNPATLAQIHPLKIR